MAVYFKYNTTTGVIVAERGYPGEMPGGISAGTGNAWIEKTVIGDTSQHYVDVSVPEILVRPVMPITVPTTSVPGDGVSEIVISGLPVGTSAVCSLPDGKVNVIVDDSTLEVSSDVPGIGEVQLSHGLHLSQTIEVTFT